MRIVERKDLPAPRKDKKTDPKPAAEKKDDAPEALPEDDIFSAADPRDVFRIGRNEANYEIVRVQRQFPGGREYSVVTLPEGVTSNDFSATPPVEANAHGPDPNFRLPAGFTPIARQGYSEQGLPLRIQCDKDSAVMALVPAGVFQMGTSDGPPECGPPLSMFLDAYYIDVTEVTVAQYERFQQEVRRADPAEATADVSAGEFPIVGVAWSDASSYAGWSKKTLPTEAQWEKAARSEQNFKHPWGNGPAIWNRIRDRSRVDPVGSFPSDMSPYGVLDLAGNAREWCLDYFLESAYEEAAAGGSATLRNWTGPRASPTRTRRVVKGGGPNWEVWHRTGVEPREKPADAGFRCVLVLPAVQ